MAEQKRIWDNYKVMGEVQKSDGIKFVIAAATRDGFRYINIREFYIRKRDNVWMPGRDGITIPLLAPLNKGESFITPFKDVIEVLMQTVDVAANMDLIDEANTVYMPKKESKQEA